MDLNYNLNLNLKATRSTLCPASHTYPQHLDILPYFYSQRRTCLAQSQFGDDMLPLSSQCFYTLLWALALALLDSVCLKNDDVSSDRGRLDGKARKQGRDAWEVQVDSQKARLLSGAQVGGVEGLVALHVCQRGDHRRARRLGHAPSQPRAQPSRVCIPSYPTLP